MLSAINAGECIPSLLDQEYLKTLLIRATGRCEKVLISIELLI